MVAEVIINYNILVAVMVIPLVFLFEVCRSKNKNDRRVYDNFKRNVTVNIIASIVIKIVCKEIGHECDIATLRVGVVIRTHTVDVALQ